MIASIAVVFVGQFKLFEGSLVTARIQKAEGGFDGFYMKKLRINANDATLLKTIADRVLLKSCIKLTDRLK